MARDRADDYADEEYDDAPRRPRRDRTARARDLVSGPAVGLIVAGALSLLSAVLGIAQQVTGMNDAQFANVRRQWDADPKMDPKVKAQMTDMLDTYEKGAKVGLPVVAAVNVATGILVIVGGLKMKSLSSKGWATIASVLAMLPCVFGCCLIGLPIGIWALVTLGKPEVKAAFAAADPMLAGDDFDDRT